MFFLEKNCGFSVKQFGIFTFFQAEISSHITENLVVIVWYNIQCLRGWSVQTFLVFPKNFRYIERVPRKNCRPKFHIFFQKTSVKSIIKNDSLLEILWIARANNGTFQCLLLQKNGTMQKGVKRVANYKILQSTFAISFGYTAFRYVSKTLHNSRSVKRRTQRARQYLRNRYYDRPYSPSYTPTQLCCVLNFFFTHRTKFLILDEIPNEQKKRQNITKTE